MSDILFKAMPGQVNVDEAKGIVECFVAGIGNKDSVGDIVLPGAFAGSLRRRKPRVVWGHDWNQPIGKVLEIFEVPNTDARLPMKMKQAGIGGLFARVQFNLRSERGREAFASIAFFGEDQEWSIGYKTLDAVYDNERKANLLREVELYEVSPVLHGANQLTGTISIKSEKQEDRTDSFGKSKWKMFDRSFAERIKEDYPEIWKKGGNIKGNDQYEILTKIAEQGGKATTEDQIKALELREAWVARHEGDFRLAGVVAQMKWLAIGSRGEDHMKKTVNDAIKKMKMREKSLDWDDDWDDWDEVDEKGYGKPNKDKLQALMDAVLKAVDELEDDEMSLDDEDFSDTEEKDKFWKLRRLLGMSPGSSVEPPAMARPVWEDDEEEDDEMPVRMRKPMGCGCGCGSKNSCVVEDAEYALKFVDDLDLDHKAGRVLSTNNMQKLQSAIDLLKEVLAAGGRQDIEMKEKHALFIESDTEELFGLKELIDPILDFYELDFDICDNGIFVKSDAEIVEKAINTALTNYFSGNIEYKGIGNSIGRSARRVASSSGGRRSGQRLNLNANFDPNARDADNDGTVQEGTRFARPAAPSKPQSQLTKPVVNRPKPNNQPKPKKEPKNKNLRYYKDKVQEIRDNIDRLNLELSVRERQGNAPEIDLIESELDELAVMLKEALTKRKELEDKHNATEKLLRGQINVLDDQIEILTQQNRKLNGEKRRAASRNLPLDSEVQSTIDKNKEKLTKLKKERKRLAGELLDDWLGAYGAPR